MTKEIRMPAPRNFSKKADQLYRFLEGSWELVVRTTDRKRGTPGRAVVSNCRGVNNTILGAIAREGVVNLS